MIDNNTQATLITIIWLEPTNACRNEPLNCIGFGDLQRRHQRLQDCIQQAPALEDHHVHEVGSAQLAEPPRWDQRENKGTDHIQDRSVQGVKEREKGVGKGKD